MSTQVFDTQRYELWLSLEEKIDRLEIKFKRLEKMMSEAIEILRIQMRR